MGNIIEMQDLVDDTAEDYLNAYPTGLVPFEFVQLAYGQLRNGNQPIKLISNYIKDKITEETYDKR